jgi:hypothetical protein
MRTLNKTGLLICLALVATSALLTGCNENRDRTTGIAEYEVQAEGCTVKYIDNPKGYNFFIAKCPAASETTTYQRPQGKGSVPTATVTTGPSASEISWQLEVAQARARALDKLTDLDKRMLGIKE